MKYGILFSIFFLFNLQGIQSQVPAENQTQAPVATMTTKFKVYGNCGMCKKRIEKAAKVEGVSLADWDEATQMLTVIFELSKVTPRQLHKAVAAVGHDTDKERASDEVYENLHGCCQYERRQ
ncbi:MAG: heavy-metal-associated domain-containing protein [Saprospiraceae bacterium]|nr:heavy-metal-associated domain-containing protein [Saprospiraceae bacterium]